jgi:dihydrofolate synthase/folylpolyglutamate synthase
MLRLLTPEFDAIVLTRYVENPRAADPAELLAIANSWGRLSSPPRQTGMSAPLIEIAERPDAALQRAREIAGPQDLICITGSFFLAAELRPLLAPSTVEGL